MTTPVRRRPPGEGGPRKILRTGNPSGVNFSSTATDPVSAVQPAMAEVGIVTDYTPEPDGVLHRFDVHGDRRGAKNGWIVFFGDGIPTAKFGCWKRGIREVWSARSRDRMTPAERQEFARRVEIDREERDRKKIREGKRHRRHLNEVWRESLSLGSPRR